MSYKIITNLEDAKKYIEELQKSLDFQHATFMEHADNLIRHPGFRLYGKTLTQLRLAVYYCDLHDFDWEKK